MSITPRATTAVLLSLLAGFLVLAALPNDAANVRLAGLSLIWWYGGLLAPAAAVLAAGVGARRRPALPPSPGARRDARAGARVADGS
jgi:hypothetical protein